MKAINYIAGQNLSATAKLLWLVLEAKRSWRVSVPELAATILSTPPTVLIAVRALEEAGLLTVERQTVHGVIHTYTAGRK